MPYGLPSGGQLRDRIIDICRGNGSAEHIAIVALGYDSEDIYKFGKKFSEGDWGSIDEFLQSRKERRDRDLGKRLIAAALIPAQLSARFTAPQPRGHWYNILLPHVIGAARSSRSLKIITFNYDMTVEHYLCTVLMSRGNLSHKQAMAEIKRLDILHLHGRLLGTTELLKGPFEKCVDACGRSIVVVDEAEDNNETFMAARRILNASDYIYFIGFGFADVNLRRLGIPAGQSDPRSGEIPSSVRNKAVYCTKRGMTLQEWKKIKLRFRLCGADLAATAASASAILRGRL